MSAADRAFREDPGKYWNFTELTKVPAYRNSPYADSKVKGLRDLLVTGAEVKGKKAEFFAYVGYPSGPVPQGGFPGIVLIHGGGGTAYPEFVKLWNSRGYAVIAPDWYNQRPVAKNPERRKSLEGGKRQDHVVNVANMVLAHSLLRSLKDVNPDKTAFVGLSWGSWYGAIVAAVDPRFKGGIEIYCGDVNYDIPVNSRNALINGRFHHAAKIPMYWIAGSNDQSVTMKTLRNAFHECPMIVNQSLVIRLPHSHVGFRFQACFRMADYYLKGGAPLPRLGKPEIKNGIIRAPVLSLGKGFDHALLAWTDLRDEKKEYADHWFKRVWKKAPAQLNGQWLEAKLPKNARQCFLSLYDEKDAYRTCCGSTDPVDLP